MKLQATMNVQSAHAAGDGMMQISLSEVRDEKKGGLPIGGSINVPVAFARAALGAQITITLQAAE